MRATDFIIEQENPKVDLTPNYPNYEVLIGEFIGVKKNRLLFKILSAKLKPGQGETEKIGVCALGKVDIKTIARNYERRKAAKSRNGARGSISKRVPKGNLTQRILG